MLPLTYRLEVGGRLPSGVLDELAGFTIEFVRPNTTLCGPFADTAALYGLIARLEALGLPLVSVQPVDERNHQQERN